MLAVVEIASVVGRSTNSNVTLSTVEFSTSYVSNVVNGKLDDEISTKLVDIGSPVVLSASRKKKRRKKQK